MGDITINPALGPLGPHGAPAVEWCEGCNRHHPHDEHDYVWSAWVRRIDPPQHVEDPDDVGQELGLEQCDECGSSTYRILEGRKIECIATVYEEVTVAGCGRIIPLVERPAPEVQF